MAQFNLSITLEYDILRCIDPDILTEVINKRISEDWQPLGGAFMFQDRLWCQTIVREKPKPLAEKVIDEVAKFETIARY